MKVAYVLYHIARADFLERVRRYSFLLTLGFAGFVVLQAYTGHIYLSLGDYSGSASSAWFGAFLGLVAATFLSLTGFYIVKNTIQRDELTRVGRILAATPMTRLLYIAGKALSNFAVLAAMVFVLALAATAMQLLRGHGGIDFWELLSPFILLALPVMATVAALAVLFETLPILRGGVGNVAYFFLWSGLFSTAFTVRALDFTGVSFLIQSMGAVVKKLDPSYHGAFTLQAGGAPTAAHRFQWDGLHWTSGMVLQRLLWVGVAIALTCLAALFFRRFDPAREAGQSR
ncbi:MAG TPA: hypothetical protein VEW69_11565, partial [Alphaproteobacteria bacterium]|nr:hypothetical protein [Alphaproteobacteria bacterium]